ncbi:MAG: hypothetical protein H6R15_3697 [Proteobacteria bacterium]|nr:hypothetical protein [Pseudomonadota bacterium]
MRAFLNTLMKMRSVLSSGRSALKAAYRRQTCGCAFIMQVSGVSSKPWQIHRKGRNA